MKTGLINFGMKDEMRAQRHDCAVALCCDRHYFPLALFVARQIAFHNPSLRFDILIASQDQLDLPDWAQAIGVRLHRLGQLPDVKPPEQYRGSMAAFFRLLLPRALQDQYRRLLYLDCDVFIEGGDFARLLDLDIGSHAIAAVRDALQVLNPGYHAHEFRALGWPAYKYLNSGVQLIDTARFVAEDLDQRAFAMYPKNARRHVSADQSLLNLALRGEFAELGPAWNWQLSGWLPWITARYPVFVRHFIGPKKPYLATDDQKETRYLQAYRDHFRFFGPDAWPDLPDTPDPEPPGYRQIARLALRHFKLRHSMTAVLRDFKDPYRVRI